MQDFNQLLTKQKQYFHAQNTKPYSFRVDQLKKLKFKLKESEKQFEMALKADLGKGAFESYLGEIGYIYKDISHTLSHLKRWMEKKHFVSPMVMFPATSFIQLEPYGSSLVIAPYNYPYQLLLSPLIGSMAAGNCSILKPSEMTSHTQAVFCEFFEKHFSNEYIACVGGGLEESKKLLELNTDFIFFTGSPRVGKIVMKQAADNLTPVCLELGGKSPCIVDESADLDVTARRIVWGKFFNAGQTCVAPDYVYVHQSVESEFLEKIKNTIRNFYGDNPQKTEDYGRIVNQSHFERIKALIDESKLFCGGKTNDTERYIEPTVLKDVLWSDPVMSEEIFGPVLPVLSYQNEDEMITKIQTEPKPLALYAFTRNKRFEEKILERLSFGGGCINDCIVHLGDSNLPFGGVGQSGIGAYHGEYSFKTFSHPKAVVKNSFWVDLKIRYAPYTNSKLSLIRKLFR